MTHSGKELEVHQEMGQKGVLLRGAQKWAPTSAPCPGRWHTLLFFLGPAGVFLFCNDDTDTATGTSLRHRGSLPRQLLPQSGRCSNSDLVALSACPRCSCHSAVDLKGKGKSRQTQGEPLRSGIWAFEQTRNKTNWHVSQPNGHPRARPHQPSS